MKNSQDIEFDLEQARQLLDALQDEPLPIPYLNPSATVKAPAPQPYNSYLPPIESVDDVDDLEPPREDTVTSLNPHSNLLL
jgi:hypothetical protein